MASYDVEITNAFLVYPQTVERKHGLKWLKMASNAFQTQLIIFFGKKSVENDPDQTPHPPSVEFSTLFFTGSGSLIKKWFKTKKKCGNFYKGGVKVIPYFF